jgi:hypothetical protein
MICVKGGTVEKTRFAEMAHDRASRPRLLMDAENGSIEADGPVNDEDGTLFGFFLPSHPSRSCLDDQLHGREHFPIKWIPVDRRKCDPAQKTGERSI